MPFEGCGCVVVKPRCLQVARLGHEASADGDTSDGCALMWKWGRASDDKLIERVCALITNALDLPRDFRLVEETRLHGSGLGVDSLDALRLVAELEDEFNITVDDTEL